MKFQKTRESTMVYIASIFLIIQLVVSLIYSFEWNKPHYGVFSNIVFTISMVAYILFAFIILFDNRKMHEFFIIISVIALIVSSLWSIIESIQYVNLLKDMLNGLIDLEEMFIMPIDKCF
jgi:glucan phosphoethanolaminetransferase (alkaline phosphatase superfamily)